MVEKKDFEVARSRKGNRGVKGRKCRDKRRTRERERASVESFLTEKRRGEAEIIMREEK